MNCIHGVDLQDTCHGCGREVVAAKVDVAPRPPILGDEHLGDGVYASFDGYQIWLAVNDHHHKVVALEPGVMAELLSYARRIWRLP